MRKEDFIEVLKSYDIGNYLNSKEMFGGHSAKIYLVKTTEGNFTLKLFQSYFKKLNQLSFKATEYLHNNGINVPYTLRNKSGKIYSSYNKSNVFIRNYIHGKSVKKLTNLQVIELAKLVGKINCYLANMRSVKRRSKRFLDYLIKTKFLPINNIDVERKKNILIQTFNEIDRSKLKRSVVHRDIRGDNILVNKGKIVAIIDWDIVRYDYVAFDLGALIHGFFLRPKIRPKQIKLFLNEYQKYIKLNEEEKKATYYFALERILEVIGLFQWKYSTSKDKSYIKRNHYLMKSYLDLENFGLDKFVKLFSR